MPSLPHRVRRLRWQVRVGSTARALDVRRELRDRLTDALLPALERAFDAADPGDVFIHVPRLTLELCVDETTDLVAALSERVEVELRAALAAGSAATSIEGPVRRESSAGSARAEFLAYLATGRVAWHALAAEPSDPGPLAALRKTARAMAEIPGASSSLPGDSLEARRAAAFRWLALLDPPARAALLRQTLDAAPRARPATEVSPVRDLIRRLLQSPERGALGREHLEALLLALRDEDLAPGSGSVERVQMLLRELAPMSRRPEIAAELERGPEPPPMEPRSDGATPRAAGPPPAGVARPVPQAERDGTTLGENATASRQPPGLTDPSDLPENPLDGLIADDAGLVLLHPYLPRLFQAVGVAREGRQIAADHVPRAGALLHWVVTGLEDVHEAELTVVKVLLGLSPRDPLLIGPGLIDEAERTEADRMLGAAIDHWGALGRTSVEGFRLAFLRRRGLLWEDDDGWRLRVEPRAFDMLLGRLPWGFNVVRMPWMNRPIFTDWATP